MVFTVCFLRLAAAAGRWFPERKLLSIELAGAGDDDGDEMEFPHTFSWFEDHLGKQSVVIL